MSKKSMVVRFFLILSTVSVFCHSYAQAQNSQNECAAPANTSFVLSPQINIISNYSVTVQFTSLAESADRLEWDFGDGQKEIQNDNKAGDFGKPSNSYSYAGTYTVKLTAVKECGGKEPKSATFTQDVNVFDARLLTCDKRGKITESDVRVYRIDALIYWIKSLRKDIAKKKERLESWKSIGGALKEIKKMETPATKISEMKKIIESLGKPESMQTDTTRPEGNANILKQESEKLTGSTVDNFIADVERVRALELAEDRELLNSCNASLAVLEYVLRKRGDYILDRIHTENDLKQTQGISDEEVEKHDDEIKKLKERARKIKPVTPLAGDDLIQTFDEYPQYFFRFNAGYEFVTVDKLFQKGFPRIGFMLYMARGEKYITDDYPGGFGCYGVHQSFSAQVTSSAEQETNITPDTQPPVKNTGDNSALEFNMELFVPLYRTPRFNNGRLWEYIGPVVLIGGKKVESSSSTVSNHIDSRLYGGLKLTINPELFADFLYGRTSGLQSERLEIRAQLPVYRFQNGSRFILGAIGNMGVKNKVEDEADDLRIFVTWNVNFESVFEYFSGKKMEKSSTQ